MSTELVKMTNPNDLIENSIANKLYSIPENYEEIKENIRTVGILTPIIAVGNIVQSGNLRLRIAKELGLNLVPVIFREKGEFREELIIISHAQQRIKKYSEVLREYEILCKEYPIVKGCRTDLYPEMKENIEKRDSLKISKTKLNQLKNIKKISEELYGKDSEEYKDIWSEIDTEKTSLSSMCKRLQSEKDNYENNKVLPESYSLNKEKAKIYCKSCRNLAEISDNSIACIITSPPYFQMVDYGTGPNQRGMESEIDKYISELIKDFGDCKRVLRDDGSLWVNLNEPALKGEYHSIIHQFAISMRKEGWKLNDEIIWIKNNPQFTQAKRSVRSHEYILHFVKSDKFYYDISWLKNITDPNNLISLGTTGKVANLISGMDFRDSIIRTNANNMNELRKACKKNGFNLTHSAGYPLSIPLIAILTSSKVDDTVLDIYSGTGTSGEAALATQRKYVGYEIKTEFAMASGIRLEPYIESQDEFIRVAA